MSPPRAAPPPAAIDPPIPSALLRTDAVYRTFGPARDRIGCGLWLARPGADEIDVAYRYGAVGWVLRGAGDYVDAGGRWALRPGCAYVRLPGRRHSVRFGSAYAECWFDLGEALADVPRLVGLVTAERPVLEPGIDLSLLRRADRLIATLRDAAEGRVPELAIEVTALVGALLALERRHGRDRDAVLVDEACRLLADGAPRARLERLARAHGVSYERLRKLFAARVGCAPGAYRARRRFDRARELLLADERPVRAIADDLGFASVASFSRGFLAHVGQPPDRFRRGRGQRG